MSSIDPRDGRRGRWARYQRPGQERDSGSPYELSEADALVHEKHFGVARDQIEHDFVISHILAALAPHADRFVFFGGTALSRTILNGLRLSEDIDLLSVGSRLKVATTLDGAIRSGLERGFGEVTASPWLSEVKADTAASIYGIGNVWVRIQLLDGRDFADWPRQVSEVSQRYSGLPNLQLTTYTPAGFVGAKTAAWCDSTRNAARDLYDLWALASAGHVTAEAAAVYRRRGPTGGVPRPWSFPKAPPTESEWRDTLGYQCIPEVHPDEAYETVVSAWKAAVVDQA